MKNVFVRKVTIEDGIPCIYYNVTMISVHDTKIEFGVGFMLVDRKKPRIEIFNDEGVTIGIINEMSMMKRFLQSVIKNKGYNEDFSYIFPPTYAYNGMLFTEPVTNKQFSEIDKQMLQEFRHILKSLLEIEK